VSSSYARYTDLKVKGRGQARFVVDLGRNRLVLQRLLAIARAHVSFVTRPLCSVHACSCPFPLKLQVSKEADEFFDNCPVSRHHIKMPPCGYTWKLLIESMYATKPQEPIPRSKESGLYLLVPGTQPRVCQSPSTIHARNPRSRAKSATFPHPQYSTIPLQTIPSRHNAVNMSGPNQDFDYSNLNRKGGNGGKNDKPPYPCTCEEWHWYKNCPLRYCIQNPWAESKKGKKGKKGKK
jgi:hypothetical protein